MGLRGPKGKPPELKLLEGNRGHRPVDAGAGFRPEVGAPSVPKYLSREARKAWVRISRELVRYNVLSQIDRDAFAMLCQTIGRLEVVERALSAKMAMYAEKGIDVSEALMDITPNGLRIQGALYQVLNKEQEKLQRMLASFGLSPDARAKVSLAVRSQLQLFEAGKQQTGFAGFE